jgi:hypothetical protein
VKDAPPDISGQHEMKLWALEVLLLCHLQKNCIRFNSKLNSLQKYGIEQNYRIMHIVVEHLCQHNLKILHHHHV